MNVVFFHVDTERNLFRIKEKLILIALYLFLCINGLSARNSILRPVAEFDQSKGVLIAYPLGIPIELVREISLETKVYCATSITFEADAIQDFEDADVFMDNVVFLLSHPTCYHTRDYGPLFAFDVTGELIALDYLDNSQSCQGRETNNMYTAMESIPIYEMGIRHEGGNYMTDGIRIAASTTGVYSMNDNNVSLVDQVMAEFLGIQEHIVITDPLASSLQHIDCFAKFLSPDKVLISEVPRNNSNHDRLEATATFFSNTMSSWGRPFEVIRVQTPNNEPYTNSLILNDRVFVPIMGGASAQSDENALQVYAKAMPGYRIIGVLNNRPFSPWFNLDALHCRVKELAESKIVNIDHIPLARTSEITNLLEITAAITSFTDSPLLPDSIRVFYKINESDFIAVKMNPDPAKEGMYSVVLTGFEYDDFVKYYIRAVDSMGVYANHPYIGAPMAHLVHITTVSDADKVTEIRSANLIGNSPNPFNPTTTIKFQINNPDINIHSSGLLRFTQNGETHVNLDIFNIKGQKVRSLVNGVYTAGEYTVIWNGTDESGGEVASGVYFYRMSAEGFTETRKMLLMK